MPLKRQTHNKRPSSVGRLSRTRFIEKEKRGRRFRHGKQSGRIRKKRRVGRERSGARLCFDGQIYASPAERELAKILTERRIPFRYAVRFDTKRADGQENFREVDFLLDSPIEIYWCPRPVTAIEVKGGYLDERAWWQRRELREAGVHTFIATFPIIKFWRDFAFLRSEALPATTISPSSKYSDRRKFYFFRGTHYDIRAHREMAEILSKNRIRFRYKHEVMITNDRGEKTAAIVDFWLEGPIKIYWVSHPVQIIDIELVLTPASWEKRQGLKRAGLQSFMATKYMVSFWRRYAFLRAESVPDKRQKQKTPRPILDGELFLIIYNHHGFAFKYRRNLCTSR